jgi:hypothetical protein
MNTKPEDAHASLPEHAAPTADLRLCRGKTAGTCPDEGELRDRRSEERRSEQKIPRFVGEAWKQSLRGRGLQ